MRWIWPTAIFWLTLAACVATPPPQPVSEPSAGPAAGSRGMVSTAMRR